MIPTSDESREMETAPTPIEKHKLLASASAELLLESDDDEKEFSELQNSQITVANRTHNLQIESRLNGTAPYICSSHQALVLMTNANAMSSHACKNTVKRRSSII